MPGYEVRTTPSFDADCTLIKLSNKHRKALLIAAKAEDRGDHVLIASTGDSYYQANIKSLFVNLGDNDFKIYYVEEIGSSLRVLIELIAAANGLFLFKDREDYTSVDALVLCIARGDLDDVYVSNPEETDFKGEIEYYYLRGDLFNEIFDDIVTGQ